MKIRIKGNSIRYRLTRPEVEGFNEQKAIIETVDFGSQILTYGLIITNDIEFSATYVDHTIMVHFPLVLLNEWKSTEKVGYKAESGMISILIEKDFTCLDNVEEDQSENYPNPLSTVKL
ncbi:hypothetical protein [Pedobacter sp. Leaf250]|uniref:DUF7009 family protein n=1 Tax=Pedobacter sp. Leaf250 TaxID=2876559 RepID=UPI001E46721F|nr:hypothetical protein [Pedobacter sp. Leaf250]